MKPFESHLTIGLVLICCANTSKQELWWTIFMGFAILFLARAIAETFTTED
jgi:hypothetical protein